MKSTWRDYGLVSAVLALALFGCDSSSDPKNKPAADMADQEHDSNADPGNGDATLTEIASPEIAVAANDKDVRAPMDATPSPDGKRVYYTALQRGEPGEDTPGVFSADASGGDIETLALGGLLQAPVGISVSLDGERLFVADTAAGDGDESGAILSLPAKGGDPEVVSGTLGYVPSGVAIADLKGEERLYFTGRETSTGRAGLFRVGLSGGTVQAVAPDAEFGDPAGIAVAADGTAYVVDALSDEGSARLVRVRGNAAEVVVDHIGVGFPAGVAITRDASTVLVSGIDPNTQRDIVYVVNAADGKLSMLSKPFREFSEAAGLHRAHEKNVFAWADSEANGSGTVYVLKL
jgi:DNA-binding beta-propeller fold protein YncE